MKRYSDGVAMAMQVASLREAIVLARLALNEGDTVELVDNETEQSWQDAEIMSLA